MTGTFTVPYGGEGFYYFSVYLTVPQREFAFCDLRINGENICLVYGDKSSSTTTDFDQASCSAAVFASEDKHLISFHLP